MWLLLAALAGLAAPARAQVGAPDSGLVAPARPAEAPADSPADRRNARGERLRPWHRAPWAIMSRSALVPGWGQWANGRHVKALLVAAGEGVAVAQLADAMGDTDDALARQRAALAGGDDAAIAAAAADYDAAYNRRATWAWLTGAAIALSMLDAYVDAHLLQFDADFGPDPKLFDEDDAARGRVGGGGADLRLGLRLAFTGP